MSEVHEAERHTLRKKSAHASKALIKYTLSSVGGAVLFIMVANPVTNWWSGPAAYKVYLVGDFRAGQEAGRAIRDGFLEKGSLPMKVDSVPVEIEARDDEGDASLAERISSEIQQAGDALMVVGHLSSTQTKAALPNYLHAAEPAIPVVLAAETNPHLFSLANDTRNQERSSPVLRIPPTDDRQASDAAAFAISRGASTFWIIEDSENPVYSKYLAGEFVRHLQEKKQNVVVWSHASNVPSFETYRALKPDCVFFAGSASNALIVIRQLRVFSKAASLKFPMVILTDSAADKSLIQGGGPDVEGVHLIYPWPAKEFSNGNDGFKAIGRDARAVVEALLDEASRRYSVVRKERGWLAYSVRSTLRIHRTSDARDTVVHIVDRAMHDRVMYNLSANRKALFTSNYRNDIARFYIWKIESGEFTDVQ